MSTWWVDRNKLRNTYYVVRHGRSLANEAGIVVSDAHRSRFELICVSKPQPRC